MTAVNLGWRTGKVRVLGKKQQHSYFPIFEGEKQQLG